MSSHKEDYGVIEMIDRSCIGERVLLSHNGVNKGLMETQWSSEVLFNTAACSVKVKGNPRQPTQYRKDSQGVPFLRDKRIGKFLAMGKRNMKLLTEEGSQ